MRPTSNTSLTPQASISTNTHNPDSTDVMNLPNEIHLEIAKHLDWKDTHGLMRTNRHFYRLLGHRLYEDPTIDRVDRVIETGSHHALGRLLNAGLDPNAPAKSMWPLLESVMRNAQKGRTEMLKLVLDDPRTDTTGFTLYTTPTHLKEDGPTDIVGCLRAAGVRIRVVENVDMFPLESSKTWLGGLDYEKYDDLWT
jgi:hypothetical protein